jgi:hypothetical protein
MGETEGKAPGQPTNALLAAALDLAARGWPVFPLQPVSKVPLRGSRGCLEATCAAATIARWWQRWPRANIAVATGRGLVVLDEDTYKGVRTEDWALPETLTVATARGGRHWYFACADPLASLPEGQLGPGIGLKARGGYVVAPPSRYRGAPYRWVDVAQPVAPLPATVRARIAASHHGDDADQGAQQGDDTNPSGRWVERAVARARREGRNNAGLWLAQQLLWNDCADPAAAIRRYARQAAHWERPAYTEREALATLRQARRQRKRAPAGQGERGVRTLTAPGEAPGDSHDQLHSTDLGNARRFVRQHQAVARYVAAWHRWLIWDGRRWHSDTTGAAQRLAATTVRALHAEAAAHPTDAIGRTLTAWALRSEASG